MSLITKRITLVQENSPNVCFEKKNCGVFCAIEIRPGCQICFHMTEGKFWGILVFWWNSTSLLFQTLSNTVKTFGEKPSKICQKNALRVQRYTSKKCFEKITVLIFSLFQRRNCVLFEKHFRQGWQNCKLRERRSTLRNFFSKKTFRFFWDFEESLSDLRQKALTCQKCNLSVQGKVWGKPVFFQKSISVGFLSNFSKKFLVFRWQFLAGLLKVPSTCPERYCGWKVFLGERKKFIRLSELWIWKYQVFGKKTSTELSKLLSTFHVSALTFSAFVFGKKSLVFLH